MGRTQDPQPDLTSDNASRGSEQREHPSGVQRRDCECQSERLFEKRIASFLASNPLPPESNHCVLRRLLKQFVAIVAGNLLYFFLLMPHLPLAGRHIPYRIDLGLLVDLWVCLVLYGIVEGFDRQRRNGVNAKGPGGR